MGITNGKRKWTRKTSGAGNKYARNLDVGDYIDGIVDASDGRLTTSQVQGSDAAKGYAAFAGQSDAELASAYNTGVQGKEDKWERNWLRAFGG